MVQKTLTKGAQKPLTEHQVVHSDIGKDGQLTVRYRTTIAKVSILLNKLIRLLPNILILSCVVC